jgi:hypothetical protein
MAKNWIENSCYVCICILDLDQQLDLYKPSGSRSAARSVSAFWIQISSWISICILGQD